MVKREHPDVDLTVEGDHGEPAAQRAKVEEPDHLLCPIRREMFRDPVVLVESGHTYEREAIEQHLRRSQIDPRSNVRIGTKRLVTNWSMRNAVQAWLDENPNVMPDGWTSRGMLPLKYPDTNSNGTYDYNAADVVVLCRWRESCPELRDLWRGNDPGRWEGVTWSDGRVTELKLDDEGLSGQLPRLEGLTSLRTVNLSHNQLTGPIPEKLFEGLTSLEYVELNFNQVTGQIPEKLFKGMDGLRTVHMYSNQLTGPIPEKLFEGLTSLQYVWLGSNQLLGPIPEKLFQGLSLGEVDLSYNQISGPIPEKLFEGLTSLESVDIGLNHLSGPIPEKLFEGLTRLTCVSLSNNQLSGPIPEKLFETLTCLVQVELSSNQLCDIPEKLFKGMYRLRKVLLSHNRLNGELPEKLFEGLTSLKELWLNDNNFQFQLPANLFRGLTSLQRVHLERDHVCHDLLPFELQEIIDL